MIRRTTRCYSPSSPTSRTRRARPVSAAPPHWPCRIPRPLWRGGGHAIVSETAEIGEMPGRILRAARGEHGFGYDPLFVPDDQPERAAADHPLTSAEMDAAEKNAISHRGKAIKALVPAVEALLR